MTKKQSNIIIILWFIIGILSGILTGYFAFKCLHQKKLPNYAHDYFSGYEKGFSDGLDNEKARRKQ